MKTLNLSGFVKSKSNICRTIKCLAPTLPIDSLIKLDAPPKMLNSILCARVPRGVDRSLAAACC